MHKSSFASQWWVITVFGLMTVWPALAQNQVLDDLNSLSVEAEKRCSNYERSHYSYPQSVEPKIVDAQGGAFSPYDFTCFSDLKESDIEHITATSEAHDSGMCGRPREEKRNFARDLLNLTLATPSLNRHQKGAKDAAEWVPDKNKCWFATTIIQTKKKYNLSVDPTEKNALQKLITDCTSTGQSLTMEIPNCRVKTTMPQLTINDVSANEALAMTFTVTLDREVSGGFSVTPSFTDGTATKGTDYAENTQAIRFKGTANEKKTFTVSTTEDDVVEADETFTVGLTVSGATETITATDTGIGTILDDDIPPIPAVTINDASADEGDPLTFTITLDNTVSGGFSVIPKFTDGTATEGTDYTENTQSINFAGTANETKTFTVSTTQDELVESDETFIVALTVSGTNLSINTTDTGTGSISSDDRATLTINDVSIHEGDVMTLTITLDNAVDGGFRVTPSFIDGTALKGTDYTENTQAIRFTGTANETQTFTVVTIEDNLVEPDEIFTVGLSVSGTDAPVDATDNGTGTILNDDVAVAPSVTINDASADEGDAMTFTITLDNVVDGGFRVTPSFTDGTTLKGIDYTENIQSIRFIGTANETKTFRVNTLEDDLVESDETFTVDLSVSGTNETITSTDTGTGTILNDDVAVAPSVTINDVSAAEGDNLTFTVTLDNAIAGGFSVTPSFTDGTALKGTDYTENLQTIRFTGTANETQTLTISTIEDDLVEADETFTIGLVVSGTTHPVTSTGTAVGTILNDDQGTVTLSVIPNPVEEGSSITANVRLSNPLLIDVIFPLIFTPQTAEISDYLMLSSITIPQHELHGSGMIGTMVDEDLEDELFTISLGTLPPNMLAGDTTSIDVTILDQGMVTSTQPQVEPTITAFALEQNYPNPFNPSTSIEFSLDETQHVTLTVYDMLGQKVETIVDGVQSKGRHHVVFSATGLSSSKYFYVLQTDQNVAVNVMTLLK